MARNFALRAQSLYAWLKPLFGDEMEAISFKSFPFHDEDERNLICSLFFSLAFIFLERYDDEKRKQAEKISNKNAVQQFHNLSFSL